MNSIKSTGLRIIATGGTFDKHYDPIGGRLGFEDSHLPEILRTARLHREAVLEILPLVDSLDMVEEDRLKILESCRRSEENRIVIVHGTDTMAESAAVVGRAVTNKRIIFTGAMVPYSISRSDALFNLGTAVMASELVDNGTWAAMNGRVLPWDGVKKDKSKGIFVST